MSAQIMTWLFSLYVLLLIALVDVSGFWQESARIDQRLRRGFMIICFYSYSGTLAISTLSTDCHNDNGTTIKDFPASMDDDIKKFCKKVGASATFMWFMTFCVFLCAALRLHKKTLSLPSSAVAEGNASNTDLRSGGATTETTPPSGEIMGGHNL